MFGWMKSLFLDEKARKALDERKRAAAPARKSAAPTAPAKTPAMNPARAQLLKDAMAVHKAKRKILDDLSDEDRARLVAMAITAFLNEGRESDPDTKNKKK